MASGWFGVIHALGARKKTSLFRHVITTSTKAEPVKVAALARAIDRLDLSECPRMESVELGVSDGGLIQLCIRSAERGRRASRSARRLFEQVWYDALGEQPDESVESLVG